MARKLFLVVGILSVIVLGVAIFLPGTRGIDYIPPPEDPPEVQLETFMTDRLDYGLRFSRMLTERRIEKARRFAEEDPALESRAREVIDSLQARLEREAIM